MRLRLRRRRDDSGDRRQRAEPADHRSPPAALTRWLRQGFSAGICPLCRVAHKADREYIWQFYDERSNDGAAIDQVGRAYGFCSEHVEMLRRIDVDGMKSTLAISVMLADTFARIVEQLEAMRTDTPFEPDRCPACTARDDHLRKNTGYLLDLLATSPGDGAKFETSPGLCFGHFKLAWDAAPSRTDRELLLAVQRSASGSLRDELREHVRKQDHKFSHEPKGAERDSWQRAIYLTAGWPPPIQSAAEPERGE